MCVCVKREEKRREGQENFVVVVCYLLNVCQNALLRKRHRERERERRERERERAGPRMSVCKTHSASDHAHLVHDGAGELQAWVGHCSHCSLQNRFTQACLERVGHCSHCPLQNRFTQACLESVNVENGLSSVTHHCRVHTSTTSFLKQDEGAHVCVCVCV